MNYKEWKIKTRFSKLKKIRILIITMKFKIQKTFAKNPKKMKIDAKNWQILKILVKIIQIYERKMIIIFTITKICQKSTKIKKIWEITRLIDQIKMKIVINNFLPKNLQKFKIFAKK